VSEPSPVVVTGIGVVSPFGWGTDAFWDGLVGGMSALAPVRRFGPATPGRLGGEVPSRPVGEVARSATGRRMDWTSLMALGACRLALADAGLAPERLSSERTSLALGSAYGNLQETATFLDRLFSRGIGNPLLFPNMVFNAPLAYASIELGIRGETTMLSMLEVSGEAAIGWGVDAVDAGRAEVCLAGGVDELGEVLHRVLEDAGALAPGAPRPFAQDADGVAVGEGAAVLVLERLDRAKERGARVHARLRAPLAFTVPAPVHAWPRDPHPIARGLRSLLAEASVVFASASGNHAHDAIEGAAIAAATRAPVTAIRGAIGDFGAAGALAAAAAARALAGGVIPPTLGTTTAPRELDVVTGAARRGPLRSAVVTGLGRGGLVRALRFDAI
jgi:3-oxoacyl-[acyl-carrier-protein] synthase II